MLTSELLKAARMLLRWDQIRLAAESAVAPVTIKRIEAIDGPIKTTAKTSMKIRAALEAAGVEFIEDDGVRGAGVRLKTTAQLQ